MQHYCINYCNENYQIMESIHRILSVHLFSSHNNLAFPEFQKHGTWRPLNKMQWHDTLYTMGSQIDLPPKEATSCLLLHSSQERSKTRWCKTFDAIGVCTATSRVHPPRLLIGCLLSTYLPVLSWAPTLAMVRWFILTSLPTHTE